MRPRGYTAKIEKNYHQFFFFGYFLSELTAKMSSLSGDFTKMIFWNCVILYFLLISIFDKNRFFDTILKNYERFVKPCFDLYIQPSKKHADVVLPRGPANEIAVGLLVLNLKNPSTLDAIKF